MSPIKKDAIYARNSSLEGEDLVADLEFNTISTKSENGNNPSVHYYGERKDPSKINPSKNVYDYIKRMNLGNLSGLPKIPLYYLQFLLDYIS